ncbi:response regulator [Flavobacterium gawalongense]|uniref:Response regulator n=1 Tax=Flavobacterium gawalongense TaxID=2594432 RepID=A0A553BKA9_9FLAO|nr:response regulator [Flavobacterium gawalongense]TRX03972.1 response regulator [Flavobacterium gawalongense]TRX07149.1 response regulator [Flavobacterium gawalongense]TRX08681.1 response regulator [Flavobacterium gawalongense]TRX09482.1 response regulator [Flavobacterium gawalongense]TRX25453.1 response regulator [Flavobacterium gawalongense]
MIKDKKSYSILVIEDNLGDFMIVEELLTELILNPKITHAKNFKEASVILSSGDRFFDIILLDLTLPDKSGQNLITEILQTASLCPVIVFTGYSDVDFSTKSISQGILDYLIKDDLNATMLYKSIIYSIERKKSISLLKESEKRYSDLFHLSPQPMWVCDMDTFQFLGVNDSAVYNYGFTEDEFLKMTVKEIILEGEVTISAAAVNSPKQKDQLSTKGIYRHKKKNGDVIHVEIQSNIIYFNNQRAELVLANDITERVQYIKAIEKQNEKLQQIAWTQSHVVRAPLARMMGIVNLIKEMDSTSSEFEDLLNHFSDSGIELDKIIRNIVKKTERINIKKN